MNTITTVIVNLQIEGTHNWPEAVNVLPNVAFLSHEHRHIFHITAKKRVNNDNRDVEFIEFKREIQNYLLTKYGNHHGTCLFGSMSCEVIARELLDTYSLESCTVMEDGENGACIEILY